MSGEFSSLTAQLSSKARCQYGCAWEEAERSSPWRFGRKVAGHRLMGSSSISLRPDPSTLGSRPVAVPTPLYL